MNNKLLIALIVLGILIVGYVIFNSEPTVSAQGFSSIDTEPDEVSVYIIIETRNATTQIAKDRHDEISDKVIDNLEDIIGLDDEDIKLINYNIYPEYDWNNGKQREKGFVVTSQIVVKTDDFDLVSEIVDAGIDSGALVSSINFELSNEKQSDYKAQALSEASADARKKAESTASGLGKKLGSLVSVQSEEFYYPGPIPIYAKAEDVSEVAAVIEARQAAVDLKPQDIEVTASVRVEYRLRAFWF